MRTVSTGATGFHRALADVRAAKVRPEFRLEEVPAPARLAPESVALVAERIDIEDDATYGRFVLLHDEDGVDEWEGAFRAVVFIRVPLDDELLDDPLVHDVAWSWLTDSLSSVAAIQVGGTVTGTSGRSFGSLSDRPADGFLEIRASWTPIASGDAELEMSAHVAAWIDLLAHACGMAPLPAGVAHVASRRQKRSGA